jgi:hypothetical protein
LPKLQRYDANTDTPNTRRTGPLCSLPGRPSDASAFAPHAWPRKGNMSTTRRVRVRGRANTAAVAGKLAVHLAEVRVDWVVCHPWDCEARIDDKHGSRACLLAYRLNSPKHRDVHCVRRQTEVLRWLEHSWPALPPPLRRIVAELAGPWHGRRRRGNLGTHGETLQPLLWANDQNWFARRSGRRQKFVTADNERPDDEASQRNG